MKNTYRLLPLILALCLSIYSNAQDEKAAIKAVIEKETQAYFGVDSTSWKTFWLDAPYTCWAYYDSTGGNFIEGTKNIRKSLKDYFKTAKPAKSKIERSWIEIKVYGKGAYARFTQKVSDDMDHDITSEVRVLEKENGEWKIVYMSAMAKYPPAK